MPHLLSLAALLSLASVSEARSQAAQCRLAPRPYGFGGYCRADPAESAGGQSPRLRLPDSVRVWTTGGPEDPPPWRGNLSLPGGDLAFEIAPAGNPGAGSLVLRTGVVWLPVKEWRQIAPAQPPCAACERLAKDLLLVLDLANPPPASEDDIVILRTGLAGLDKIIHWNRQEAQTCGESPNPTDTGFFCLLYAAVEARMGRYQHRQPALELVRAVIFERWRDRITSHQLVDFNNHPATTMADLKTVLELALERAVTQAQTTKPE